MTSLDNGDVGFTEFLHSSKPSHHLTIIKKCYLSLNLFRTNMVSFMVMCIYGEVDSNIKTIIDKISCELLPDIVLFLLVRKKGIIRFFSLKQELSLY